MTHAGRKRKIDEDKEQAGMCSPVKAQMKFDAATSQQRVESSHIVAINSARQAIEHASALCQEILLATNEKYYAGAQTGIESELVRALQSLQGTTTTFQSLAAFINIRAQNAPIYKIPTEIIYLVFGHLDTDGLLASRAVCPLWRDVLASNASHDGIWKKALATIEGKVSQIDARWKKLQEIDPSPSTLCLRIWEFDVEEDWNWDDLAYDLETSRLVSAFPSDSLTTLDVRLNHPLDTTMWKLVAKCPKLKVLHWRVYRDLHFDYEGVQYPVCSTSPLASCRLEELHFEVSFLVSSIDTAFVEMLSQVKQLRLDNGLQWEHFLTILHAAKDHIEVLVIDEIGDPASQTEIKPEINCSGLVLHRLDRFSIRDVEVGILSIVAPNATSIRFQRGCSVDWTLLNSCRQNVKSLQIHSRRDIDEQLARELFDMPQLEHLLVIFNSQTRKVGLAALWRAISTSDTGKEDILLKDILPRLKKLMIIWDENMSPEAIFKLLEVRNLLDLDPIDTLQIHFGMKYPSTDLVALDELRSTMSNFSYKTFESKYTFNHEDWE